MDKNRQVYLQKRFIVDFRLGFKYASKVIPISEELEIGDCVLRSVTLHPIINVY